MKYALSLFFFLSSLFCSAQVIPLTEIEGRLSIHLPDDTTSIHIGKNAGIGMGIQGKNNTFVGTSTGRNNILGHENTFFGTQSGRDTKDGDSNSFFGAFSGNKNTSWGNSFFGSFSGNKNVTGNGNSFFGGLSGRYISDGSSNICIGYDSGPIEADSSESNRLYVDIQTSSNPLIYGEFDNDIVRINGDHEVVGEAKVTHPGIINERTSTLILESGTSKRPSIQFAKDSEDEGMNIEYDGSSTNDRIKINGYQNNPIATFLESGNVGIGTTTPNNEIEVIGSSTNGVAGFSRSDLVGVKSHILFGTDGDWYIRPSLSSGKIIIADTGGNVGVGTTTPTAPFHINHFMKLEPTSNEPDCSDSNDEGRIYYEESPVHKLRVCTTIDGTSYSWKDLH